MTLSQYLNYPMPLWAYLITGIIACYALMKWSEAEQRNKNLRYSIKAMARHKVQINFERDELDDIIDRVKGTK